MDKRVPLLVLLIALPYSVSGDGTDIWGHFQGMTVGIETEYENVSGSFLALAIDDYGTADLASPQFVLTGESIRMESDSSLAVDGGVSGVITDSSTETTNLSGHLLEGIENRKFHSMTVVTQRHGSELAAEPHCGSARPSERSDIKSPLYTETTRVPASANTEHSVEWKQCIASHPYLSIAGDFAVSLWEWDVSVTSPGGETTIERSGESPINGEASALYPHASERRQIWLFIEDGDLEIPYWENALLFVDDLTAEAGNATLESPSGELRLDGDLIEVGGERMELSGDFTLNVQGRENSLSTSATGRFADVELDGVTLEPAQLPAREETGVPLLGIIALIAAAVLVLTGTVAWYTNPKLRSAVLDPIERRRDVIFEEALAEATLHNVGRPRKGKKWVRLAMRLRPNHPEALAAMGTLLFHMKKYRKALGYFQKAIVNMHTIHRPNDVPDDAVAFWAVECARCLAGMRLIGPWEKREELSEEIMDYAHMAAKVDPGVAELLLTDKYISDLWNPIRMAVSKEDYGVKP